MDEMYLTKNCGPTVNILYSTNSKWKCFEMQVNMAFYKISRNKAELKTEMRRLFWDGDVEESKGMMIQAFVAS